MPPQDLSELRRPWRLLVSRRPWTAVLYLVLHVLGGLVTVLCLTLIVLLPVWLLVWPRIEPRLSPLAASPVPVARRAFRWQLLWRDWVLVLLSPVAGVAALVVLGVGFGAPVLLVTSALAGATGDPARVLGLTVGAGTGQAVAGVAALLLLAGGLWAAVALAHGWARLVFALLGEEEGRLAEQVGLLSEQNARAADRLALERRQLERDLHDGAQLHLGGAGMRLALLQLDIEALPADPTRTQLLAGLDEVREQLDAAAGAIRRTARGLVPETLRDGGLCAALQETADATPLTVRVECDLPRLGASTETGLYFIVTEALANTVRHAGADRVDVRAWVVPPNVLLEIGDDGCGGAQPTGTGLLGIQARARLLGGKFELDSPTGRGTRIRVRVPHRPAAPPAAPAKPATTEAVR